MVQNILIALLCMGPVVSYAQEAPAVPETKAVPTPAEQALAALKAGKYEEAAKILEPALEKGDVTAETLKGLIYLHGLGVPQDDVQAVEWLKKAAEKGHPVAQKYLGDIYYYGSGKIPSSQKDGITWWQKAADQNYPPALYRLGDRLTSSTVGGDPNPDYDPIKGKELLEAAARPDGKYPPEPEAMAELAMMYANNPPHPGIPRDPIKAGQWALRAAEHGNDMGQTLISMWYEYGVNGLPKDLGRAYTWLLVQRQSSRISRQVKGSITAHMAELEESLTPEQIESARAEAKKIMAKNAPPAK